MQRNLSVGILAEASSGFLFRGMNFWASVSPGGGATGYTRINVNLVSEGVLEEEDSPFADIFVDSIVPVDGNGDPLADPLFVRIKQDQEDSAEVVLQADLNQTWEVPESTRKIRLSGTLSSVRQTTRYSFDHHRDFGPTSLVPTVGVGAFASLPANQPLYYVVTAIYWDPDQNLEFESAYSEEVVGHPTQINTALVGIKDTCLATAGRRPQLDRGVRPGFLEPLQTSPSSFPVSGFCSFRAEPNRCFL